MKNEVKALLKFISDNGPATKTKLDISSINYDGREGNSSAKWTSDSKIEALKSLRYIDESGGRANPEFRVTSEGEKYLQDDENTTRNVKWLVITNLISIAAGGVFGYLLK